MRPAPEEAPPSPGRASSPWSESPKPDAAPPAPAGRSSWLLRRLDSLLSEDLRRAPPAELVRHRFLAGASSFLLVFTLLYVLSSLFTPSRALPGIIVASGFVGTLVLARRSRTIEAPAMLLLIALSLGLVGTIFSSRLAGGSAHATIMLLPAVAVYLLGPRLGLFVTLFVVVFLTLGHPLYRTHVGFNGSPLTLTQFWVSHFFAGGSLLGAWWLGSLHSTARDAAQVSLEQTLRELRANESKLSSLIESTDDPVVSLDGQGRVLTANSAAKRLYQERVGIALTPGQPLLRGSEEVQKVWEARCAEVRQGKRLRFEEEFRAGDTHVLLDLRISPIHGENGEIVGLTLFGRDITARKEAEARLGEMHRTLVDVSRQAGMAEIATGVLHNVGNTLNSVNVSAALVTDRLRQSRLTGQAKAINLLRERAPDFTAFLTQDPQGQKLPGYLIAVTDQLLEEREAMLQEMASLNESVEHLKSIVSMQQKHARTAGVVEEVAVPQLIDEALRLHAVSFERLNIRIERDYTQVPPIHVDRHKLLQILINLLSNARHALEESAQQDKCLTIRVRLEPEGGRLRIEVADNGEGIAPENLPRIFTQGFTTKKTGHGFGLHISALAATEMGGRLACTSAVPDQGATFTIELPLESGGEQKHKN